jgi:hypothetical protein
MGLTLSNNKVKYSCCKNESANGIYVYDSCMVFKMLSSSLCHQKKIKSVQGFNYSPHLGPVLLPTNSICHRR